jgi:phosphoglycolate phosphatase
MSTNGHKLILFDIDGTLLSAGRAARESILASLTAVFAWKGSGEGHDFSGKTDPQIVRELVAETVGPERFEEGLTRALEAYLEELARRLTPELVVPKPGVAQLLERLSVEANVTLALLTGNLERGARLKLDPPDFNRYFPFGAFGSDSPDRYRLPTIALERARAHTGQVFSGKSVVIVGDSIHDVLCGRDLGVKAVAVATGPTRLERLAAEKPDVVLESFQDVERGLEAILS